MSAPFSFLLSLLLFPPFFFSPLPSSVPAGMIYFPPHTRPHRANSRQPETLSAMKPKDARTALEEKLRRTKGSWERLPVLIALAKELNGKDFEAVHRYAQEAYTLARELNDPFWIATSTCALSLRPMRNAEFSRCITMLQGAVDIYAQLNHVRTKAEIEHMIAGCRIYLGHYPEALKLLLPNLHFFEKINAPGWIKFTLISMGDVYRLTGDWERGLRCYRRAERVMRKAGLHPHIGDIYHRIAACYRMMEDTERYRAYMFRSYVLHRRQGDLTGMAVALANIGNSYMDQGRFAEAEGYVRESGRLYRRIGYVIHEASAWARLGTIYSRRDQIDRAYRYFRRGIRLARKCEEVLMHGLIYENFADLCIATGRTGQGFRYLHKGVEIIDRFGQPDHQYKAYAKLSEACEKIGDAAQALRYYKESKRIREQYLDSKKLREAGQTEMRRKMKKLARRLQEAQAANTDLHRIIEQKEAELLSATLELIRDEEEQSASKKRGPAKRKQEARGNRGKGLPPNWEKLSRQFHKVHHEFYTSLIRRYPELTPAEVKVCSLIRIGLSSKEIAGILCISPRTVESHRMRVHRKMELPAGSSLTGYIARI